VDEGAATRLPLDGGHIVSSLVERLRGRAMLQRVYERFSTIRVTLILLITAIAFTNGLGPAAR
jgi:membrane-associated protease RseP (regulator of RpoE activity)